MKAIRRNFVIFAVCVLLAAICSSCVNRNYLIFEDDEWSGGEYGGDNLLLNGELEIDDYER